MKVRSIFFFCKKKAPRWTSWTDLNPGRRFYGCPKFSASVCGFHAWHDPKLFDRGREIILELKKREEILYGYVKELKNEVKMLKINALEIVEAKVIEENFHLKREVCNLRMQLKEMEEIVGKKCSERKGWKVWVYVFVILAVIFCVNGSVSC
ncbi:hypothetical protein REPUB_Repub07fG0041000 [Reevesia pubescens]